MTSPANPPFKPPRHPPPQLVQAIYPSDSVRLAAESVGLGNLDESVAVGLASDVEFRLHQLIEEAHKFMRHSRRTTLTPADVNHALAALSIEPIYGHLPLPSSTPHFVPLKLPPSLAATASLSNSTAKSSSKSSAALTTTSSGGSASASGTAAGGGASEIYYLSDPEVDFASLLATPPPGLVGGGVRWRAHWLAIEGVMPRVPENVGPDYRALRAPLSATTTGAGDWGRGGGAGGSSKGARSAAEGYLATGSLTQDPAQGPTTTTTQTGRTTAGAKPALSQELQLYFARLTAALLPSPEARAAALLSSGSAAAGGGGDAGGDGTGGGGGGGRETAELGEAERARLAAIASLKGDTGLQGLVVYLVRWLGEKVGHHLTHLAELHHLLEAADGLLANPTLFLEPFLHQILPILLSPLLASPLGGQSTLALHLASTSASANHPPPTTTTTANNITTGTSTSTSFSSGAGGGGAKKALAQEPSETEVRLLAGQVLGVLVAEFGGVYETLVPRLTKTLLRSLAPPHPPGRVQGALLGLAALGRHAVARALWGVEPSVSTSSSAATTTTTTTSGRKRAKREKKAAAAAAAEEGGEEARVGAGIKGSMRVRAWVDGWTQAGWTEEELAAVVAACFSVLPKLLPYPRPAETSREPTDPALGPELDAAFGPVLGTLLASDKWLAEGLLKLSPDAAEHVAADEDDDDGGGEGAVEREARGGGPRGGAPAGEESDALPLVGPSATSTTAGTTDADVSMRDEADEGEGEEGAQPTAGGEHEAEEEEEEEEDDEMVAVP